MVKRIVVCLLLAFAGGVYGAETTLTVAAKQIKGFIDSPQRGLFVEMLRSVEKISSYHFKILVLPPARAVHVFESGEADILLPHPRKTSPHARSLYTKRSYIFYQCHKEPLKEYADLHNKRVVLTRGFHYDHHQVVDKAAKVVVVSSDEIGLKMLNQGRVDATIGELVSYKGIVESLGLTQVCVNELNPLKSESVFLMFSPKRANSDAEQVINRLITPVLYSP